MFLGVTSLAGVIQLVVVAVDWLTARAERQQVTARTGVVVTPAAMRRIALRRTAKGRRSLALWRRLRLWRAGAPTAPQAGAAARATVPAAAATRGQLGAFSPEQLAQVARRAEPTIAGALAAVTSVPGAPPVTSLTLLKAAVQADPHRWRDAAATEPDRLSNEGGELLDTGWTIVAAEAVLLASNFPRLGLAMDIHDLAVAAVTLPNSNAQAALSASGHAWLAAAQDVAGLSMVELRNALVRSSRTPAGALIMPRVEQLDNAHSKARVPAGD